MFLKFWRVLAAFETQNEACFHNSFYHKNFEPLYFSRESQQYSMFTIQAKESDIVESC